MFVREWSPDLGLTWTYQCDMMVRRYGKDIAAQVCGYISKSREIAYTNEEEPTEELRKLALIDAPTLLSDASAQIHIPDTIDTSLPFDPKMECFLKVWICTSHTTRNFQRLLST